MHTGQVVLFSYKHPGPPTKTRQPPTKRLEKALTLRSCARTCTKASGLRLRTSAKGTKRWQGATPLHWGAQEASTFTLSASATKGGRLGQPSTSAIPLKDTSQGWPPSSAALLASFLHGSLASAVVWPQYGQHRVHHLHMGLPDA